MSQQNTNAKQSEIINFMKQTDDIHCNQYKNQFQGNMNYENENSFQYQTSYFNSDYSQIPQLKAQFEDMQPTVEANREINKYYVPQGSTDKKQDKYKDKNFPQAVGKRIRKVISKNKKLELHFKELREKIVKNPQQISFNNGDFDNIFTRWETSIGKDISKEEQIIIQEELEIMNKSLVQMKRQKRNDKYSKNIQKFQEDIDNLSKNLLKIQIIVNNIAH